MLAGLARGRAGRALLVGREALVPAHDAERAVRGGNAEAVLMERFGALGTSTVPTVSKLAICTFFS